MNLKKQIELWLDGVVTGYCAICGFNHDIYVEPTNGVWEPGESFRITFAHEGGDDGDGELIVHEVARNFRNIFDGRVDEIEPKLTEDGWSAVVEDVRGFGRLHE